MQPDPHQAPSLSLADGERPVDHLGRVLAEARERSGCERFLILTHRSPDPDALGAACGLRLLIERGFRHQVVVATVGRVRRAENVAMMRELGLAFEDYESLDHANFAGALIVDSQPGFGHTVVPEDIALSAVIDHHRPPDDGPAISVPHFDVREDVGATSSIVFEYLDDLGVALDQHTASAVFCGVRFDTADLSHHISPLDERAYFMTLRRADRPLVARIQKPALPPEYYRELEHALRSARRHGPLTLGLFGEVPNPESIAEMADFFLRMEGCSWVVTGGAFEGRYYVSLRSDYDFGSAYALLHKVLDGEGSFGGHGRVAGGQILLGDDSEVGVRRVQHGLRERALGVLLEHGLAEDVLQGEALA